MAGFFKDRHTNFTTALIGQEHKLFFTQDAQREIGRPRTFTATSLGQRLLDPDATGEDAQREATEVYLRLENGDELTVRLAEIEYIHRPRNDKRDLARAAGQARRRGRSLPLELTNAIPEDDLPVFSFLDDDDVPEREEIERDIEDAWHATAEARTNLPA